MPLSSSTKITVFAQAASLIDDDYDPIKHIIIGSILTGQDIAAGILNNALTGSSIQIHRMLKYARDKYTLGLPEGVHHRTQTLDGALVAAAITTDLALPHGCVVDYNYITELTIGHAVLPFLLEQRQYNKATGRIETYPPGIDLPEFYGSRRLTHQVTVDSVIHNEDASATIQYSIKSSYGVRSLNTDNETYSITTVTRPTTYFEEVYALPDPTIRIGMYYCIAKYTELDSLGNTIPGFHWWFYDVATHTYPDIDFDYTFDNTDSLFPVVPLRYKNVDYTSADKHDTDLYKTSKQLLRIVDINIDDLGNKLNENPDIAEIDHAYVTYGVNLQSNQKESIRYLVEFFDFLYDKSSIHQTDNVNSRLIEETVQDNVYSFNRGSATSLVEHGLNASVRFSYITSTYVNGSIGSIGAATKEIVIRSSRYYDETTETYRTKDDSELILRYQETTGAYKEVRVVGLIHTNRIYGVRGVDTRLPDLVDDPENDNFIIPLHYGICKRFPITIRNSLYNQALHIIIYGIHKQKVKWYQRGVFKMVTLALTIVIAIYTGNWQLVAMAITMEVLSHLLPPKLMLAIRLAFILYSIQSLQTPNQAPGTTLTTAQYFLSMVDSLAKLAVLPMEMKLLEVMGEMEDLAVEREAATKELEEIQSQLDTSSFLDAGLLLDPPRLGIVPNESPTAFYNRTLMNNAGLLVLNVVENYHTALLLLPEPDSNTAFGTS